MVVRKENNSLKVYIPKEVALALGIKEGDRVNFTIEKKV